ncbi:MAG TPA: hypothetical protein ENK57_05530, partial [Polyangiaceae bacterium]|nr:hypothetical protein [Polyangiaceae bacterium]
MTSARASLLSPWMAKALQVLVAWLALTVGAPLVLAQPEAPLEEEPAEAAAESPDEPPDGGTDEDVEPPPPSPEPRRDSRDKPPAEILFDQGLKDMLAGKYDTACPALAESFRLDPAPGALFTLAECEMGRGRLATAQTHYRDFLDRVERMTEEGKERQQQRVDVANEKLGELEGRVPTLTI